MRREPVVRPSQAKASDEVEQVLTSNLGLLQNCILQRTVASRCLERRTGSRADKTRCLRRALTICSTSTNPGCCSMPATKPRDRPCDERSSPAKIAACLAASPPGPASPRRGPACLPPPASLACLVCLATSLACLVCLAALRCLRLPSAGKTLRQPLRAPPSPALNPGLRAPGLFRVSFRSGRPAPASPLRVRPSSRHVI